MAVLSCPQADRDHPNDLSPRRTSRRSGRPGCPPAGARSGRPRCRGRGTLGALAVVADRPSRSGCTPRAAAAVRAGASRPTIGPLTLCWPSAVRTPAEVQTARGPSCRRPETGASELANLPPERTLASRSSFMSAAEVCVRVGIDLGQQRIHAARRTDANVREPVLVWRPCLLLLVHVSAFRVVSGHGPGHPNTLHRSDPRSAARTARRVRAPATRRAGVARTAVPRPLWGRIPRRYGVVECAAGPGHRGHAVAAQDYGADHRRDDPAMVEGRVRFDAEIARQAALGGQ
jgi:hypothetical protein